MKRFFVICISIMLFSCAKTSGVVDASTSHSHFKGATYEGEFLFVNSDSFPNQKKHRIFEQGATGSVSLNSLKSKAYYSARFFCSNKKGNPRVVAISEMTSTPPHLLGNFPRYELVFICYQQVDEPFHIKNSEGEINQYNKYEQLKLLKELLDSGTLTKEEFEKEKNKILQKKAS
jgi:hypothetical protein